MKTYLSKIFYYLGDLVSHLLHYNITGTTFYPLYRRLMLISISLDTNNIVWDNAENKESSRADLILKVKDENKFSNRKRKP